MTTFTPTQVNTAKQFLYVAEENVGRKLDQQEAAELLQDKFGLPDFVSAMLLLSAVLHETLSQQPTPDVELKCTPGDWAVDPGYKRDILCDGVLIGTAYGSGGHHTKDVRGAANAAMMAASKDLYNALRLLLEASVPEGPTCSSELFDAQAAAQVAMTKATTL